MVYMYNACFSERVSFESKNNYALYFVQGPRGSNFPQLCTAHLGGIDRDACYTSKCPSPRYVSWLLLSGFEHVRTTSGGAGEGRTYAVDVLCRV